MVTNPRTARGAGAVLPIKRPVPIQARITADGRPQALRMGGVWQSIARITDRWHLGPDEWWTDQPVDRMYYAVHLVDGRQLTVFQDLITQHWYRQRV